MSNIEATKLSSGTAASSAKARVRSYNETPNTVLVPGCSLASSMWATPAAAVPYLNGHAPPAAILKEAASAPKPVVLTQEEIFANQAMKIGSHLATTANSSELCAPRRSTSDEAKPSAPQASVQVAQAPVNVTQAALPGGIKTYELPQSWSEYPPNDKTKPRHSPKSPKSKSPRRVKCAQRNAASSPGSDNSSPKSGGRPVQVTKTRGNLTSTSPAKGSNRKQRSRSAKTASPTAPIQKRAVNVNADIFAAMKAAALFKAPASVASNAVVNVVTNEAKATPPHLRGVVSSSAQSGENVKVQAATTVSRPDSTDAIARRMVGQALGIKMEKKENARSIAIEAALKENASGGKKTWEDVKKDLAKIEESKVALVGDENKQKTKEIAGLSKAAVEAIADHFFNAGVQAAVEEMIKLTAQKKADVLASFFAGLKVAKDQE